MSSFESPWRGSRQQSRLRRLVASLSVLLVFVSVVYLAHSGPTLSSRASSLATPQPTIPLCCWPWFCPRVGYPDYVPHGVPDFDMRQDEWPVSTVSAQAEQWTQSGPAAAADQLWYLDSEATFVLGRPYSLVISYDVSWGDHDPRNVPPLITDLAGELQTSDSGTSVEDMLAGLESYIAKQGLADHFIVIAVKGPSMRWMLEETAAHEAVLLLLGFWQQDGGGWVRVGGHWLAVCCADVVDKYLDLADPLLDRAAAGYPGWAYGGLPPDPTFHNDAINVSYDRYWFADASVPGAQWGPADYAGDELPAVVSNSLGQNFAADLEQYRGDYDDATAVYLAADYVVLLRPLSPCYQRPRIRIYLPIIMKWHRLHSACCGEEG